MLSILKAVGVGIGILLPGIILYQTITFVSSKLNFIDSCETVAKLFKKRIGN